MLRLDSALPLLIVLYGATTATLGTLQYVFWRYARCLPLSFFPRPRASHREGRCIHTDTVSA